MRYFGTFLLLALLFFGSSEKARAATDTDTKTKRTLHEQQNKDTLDTTASGAEILTWGAILEQIDPDERAADTASLLSNRDKLFSLWKEKQSYLWEKLPEGKFTINASAYTASDDECGKSDGITASGAKVQENQTLACPPEYPFGAKISIEGYGIYTCEDRGGAIKNNHFDIYMETKTQALSFGRKNLIAEVVR